MVTLFEFLVKNKLNKINDDAFFGVTADQLLSNVSEKIQIWPKLSIVTYSFSNIKTEENVKICFNFLHKIFKDITTKTIKKTAIICLSKNLVNGISIIFSVSNCEHEIWTFRYKENNFELFNPVTRVWESEKKGINTIIEILTND